MGRIAGVLYICLFLATSAQAGEPKITETETGIIVEYTGEPAPPSPPSAKGVDGMTNTQREDLRQEIRESIARINREIVKAEQEIQEQKSKPNPADDIKVSCINAMETERSYNYVTYSIRADVDNKGGQGEIYIKLVGKNRDGHQLDFVYLTGKLDKKESRTFTTTTMMSFQKAMDIRSWEVDSINKYAK